MEPRLMVYFDRTEKPHKEFHVNFVKLSLCREGSMFLFSFIYILFSLFELEVNLLHRPIKL
jgi:hypothetical protein